MRTVTGTGPLAMPGGITQEERAVGVNFNDRANRHGNNDHIHEAFNNAVSALAQHVSTIRVVDRSAYSCAEADAVAKLFRRGVRAENITVTIATDATGYELVTPCENCLEWLEEVGGFGARRQYRIRRNLLPEAPRPAAVAQTYDDAFPAFPPKGAPPSSGSGGKNIVAPK